MTMHMRKPKTLSRKFAPGLVVLSLVLLGRAGAEEAGQLETAIHGTKWILDTRLRSEDVDQTPIANEASATTLRARLGFETGKA
jgi:hypothetical protein